MNDQPPGLMGANPYYREQIANALMGYTGNSSANTFTNRFGMEPLPLDEQQMYGRPPQQELRRAPERVWPSAGFYERNLGITNPDILDKYGQAQTGLYSALNSAMLGLPHAAMQRFAPETAKGIDEVRKSHGYTNTAGEFAGFFASPATRAFSAAGDALAARGFGVGTQAAADATAAAAVASAPSLLAGDGLPNGADNFAAGAAGARLMMPTPAYNPLVNALMGAAGGAGLSAADVLRGSWSGPIENAMLGAALGARRRPTVNNENLMPNSWHMTEAIDHIGRMGALAGAPTIASLVYGSWPQLTGDKQPAPPPSMDAPGYGDRPANWFFP